VNGSSLTGVNRCIDERANALRGRAERRSRLPSDLVLGVRPDTGGKRVDGANNHRFDAHARASGDRGDETDPIEPVVDLPNRPVEVGDATRCLGEQREQEETVRDGPAWGIRGVDVLMVVCALGKGVDPGLVDGNPGVTGRRGKDSARGVR